MLTVPYPARTYIDGVKRKDGASGLVLAAGWPLDWKGMAVGDSEGADAVSNPHRSRDRVHHILTWYGGGRLPRVGIRVRFREALHAQDEEEQ